MALSRASRTSEGARAVADPWESLGPWRLG